MCCHVKSAFQLHNETRFSVLGRSAETNQFFWGPIDLLKTKKRPLVSREWWPRGAHPQ